ncbi:MAG: hypothetical protein GWN58_22925 [Anaerolineae bacterium]|nr:hypothetical protein [Thermoplasmata archaeon]NIV32229.1 hypothetical protein [Anaerolineae bacterium]NIY03681.1 hypothetical protein [Thermoplasmata archaeon]
MNLLKKPPKKGWFKKLTLLFGGLFPFLFVVGVVVFIVAPICCSYFTNEPICDKRCQAAGYPAGEAMSPSKWRHTVCVCWPEKPGPAGYFLLERDD